MLKIRLKRAGGRNHPFYRVVVVDSRKARDSRAVEEIGYYNPLEKPLVVNVDRDRVSYWTDRGAQLSDTVKTLLRNENTTHPTRRVVEHFEPAVPEEKPKPKKKAAKAEKPEKAEPAEKPEKAEAAVAVAEPEAAAEPAAAGEGEAAASKPAEKPEKAEKAEKAADEGGESGKS